MELGSRDTARAVDAGLLVMRLGLGSMMVWHGLPKITGGPERWRGLGGAMANFGVTSAPELWGLCAALAESVGGVLVILGLLFRPAAALLVCTMIVAVTTKFAGGDGLRGASQPLEVGIAFLGLLIAGPGRHSLAWRMSRRRHDGRRGLR